jgi:peptidoglycan/xylan/chitin deacetylase (PgdA/CDA1 family)
MSAHTSHGLPGALVVSLDFELRWGVFDRVAPGDPYMRNIFGVREVVPRLLDLFAAYGVAGTWATVGFLFARSRAERERFSPAVRPRYTRTALDAYAVATGETESDDRAHYARSLVERVRDAARQELATHTFSHYYCLEPGQSLDAFRADLAAARAIAGTLGPEPTSIVFPRNQRNPAYDQALVEQGITAFRGNPLAWMWSFGDAADGGSRGRRVARLADAYVRLSHDELQGWDEVLQPSGLADVRATCFLRPSSRRLAPLEGVRLRRLTRALREAARRRRLFHLWWHPHNFGANVEQNLAFLRELLDEFARCRETYGMESMTMAEVARRARTERDAPEPRRRSAAVAGTPA